MPLELPINGHPWPQLREAMAAMKEGDLDWKHGRHGAYVWYSDDHLEEVLREAFGMFLVENGLGMRAFPSIAKMENEALSMVRSLLHGDDETAGIFTSGGTESIFLAVYAMREWAKHEKPKVSRPNIVAPHSAHPALNKAAHLQGLDVIRVPVAEDFRADVAALEAAISSETIGLYCSAPTYSLGMVDPVDTIGELAQRGGLWLHVDACVGGILSPFVRECGYAVPSFDFAIPGVTSISADLHKSGFAAKPASTVSFRTRTHRDFARYTFDDWPSGGYSTLTFSGSRPGGAIAASWAALNFLGRAGYREIAAASMRAKEKTIEGLTAIEGVKVHGEPPLYAFSWAATGSDMGAVATAMGRRGFMCGQTTRPPGIHFMATPVHEAAAEDYVTAAAESIAEARVPGAESKAAAYN